MIGLQKIFSRGMARSVLLILMWLMVWKVIHLHFYFLSSMALTILITLTLVAGVDDMNAIFPNLKIQIQACLKERTGPKMNPKHALSGRMQMIQSYQRLIKKVIPATRRPYGVGDRNFKTI